MANAMEFYIPARFRRWLKGACYRVSFADQQIGLATPNGTALR
jgi:hypothetical protein